MSIPVMASKTSSSPISIGWPGTSPNSTSSASSSVSSTSSSHSAAWTVSSSSYTNSLSCAFPSWPSRSSLSPEMQPKDSFTSNNNVPSAYISDFDLFPEDLDDDSQVPFLDEAPAPPRQRELPVPLAMPLCPLYAPERPHKKRRRSSKKVPRVVKPMSPIAECPAPE